MVNLEQTADLLSRLRTVQSETALCVLARSPRATCKACAQVCPANAVVLERGPHIDMQACIACGLCTAACPTGALRLETPSPVQLVSAVRKAAEGGAPIVVCAAQAGELPAGARGRQVLVPCTGMLTAEVLAGMLAAGPDRLLIWRPAACDACANGPAAMPLLQRAVAGVEALYPQSIALCAEFADAPGATGGEARGGNGLDTAIAAQDRRAFLGAALRGGGGLFKALLGDWLVPAKPEPGRRPAFDITGLPGRRQVLRSALEARPAAPDAHLAERLARVGPDCTLCPVCSRLCPTGALELLRLDEQTSLQWRASRCTDCGLCRDSCPARGMKAGAPMTALQFQSDAPEMLISGRETTCDCGRPYFQVPDGPHRCIACRMAAERALSASAGQE